MEKLTVEDLNVSDIIPKTYAVAAPQTEPNKVPPVTKEEQNPFPVDVFPKKVRQLIYELSEDAGYIPDFTGSSFLYAASVAVGATVRAEMFGGWTEQSVLYMSLVAPAGIGKSHPLSFAVAPLSKRNSEYYRAYNSEKANYNEKDPTAVKPVLKTIIVKDFTQEALMKCLSENPRGLGVYSDELSGWYNNFNRYHTGSEQQMWLNLFTGDSQRVDRKTSDPLLIDNPFVSIGGTIQPGILARMDTMENRESGFLDRILFAYPDNVKRKPWPAKGISDKLKAQWTEIIEKFLTLDFASTQDGTNKPQVIKFSFEADAAIREWKIKNNAYCDEDEYYSQTGAKLETYAIRLSLLMCLFRWATEPNTELEINADDVAGAVSLVEYFGANAGKVRDASSGDGYINTLDGWKKKLFNALPETFQTKAGLVIAGKVDVPERTANRFFSDSRVFKRVSQGNYKKA